MWGCICAKHRQGEIGFCWTVGRAEQAAREPLRGFGVIGLHDKPQGANGMSRRPLQVGCMGVLRPQLQVLQGARRLRMGLGR